FSESPRTPAASARQKSTSKPAHLAALSSVLMPVCTPVETPQLRTPRSLTALSVAPLLATAAVAPATMQPATRAHFLVNLPSIVSSQEHETGKGRRRRREDACWIAHNK